MNIRISPVLLLLLFLPPIAWSQSVNFVDVTESSGIAYVGPSFGASWGDANGDGQVDLWLGNHGEDPHLYINRGALGFQESSGIIDFAPNADMHGAAWADYDNDGDQDLLLLVGAESGGGEGPNQFFVNHDGIFIDEAEELGLSYRFGRGRTPMWLDYDSDGLLDVVVNNWDRSDGVDPTTLFIQVDGLFTDSIETSGITDNSLNSYSQVIMMGDEATPRIMITGNPTPSKIFDYQELPAVDTKTSSGLPAAIWAVRDTVVADFNGDLLSDVFFVRNKNASEIVELDATHMDARLVTLNSSIGFRVFGGGVLQLDLGPAWKISAENIFIGAAAQNPSSTSVVLDPSDSAMHGAPIPADQEEGVYIGYLPGTDQWSIMRYRTGFAEMNVQLSSTIPYDSIAPIGFVESDGELHDRMFYQMGAAGFIETSSTVLPGSATPCVVGTAADFDNDADVDIYLVCNAPASNRDNRLLINDGFGNFSLAAGAWGAAANVSGRGDAAISADYDSDGDMDLLVTNGAGSPPFDIGQTVLLNNAGNDNHWLEIDLEGVQSNRDALGTRVIVTAGGKPQLRENLGAMHQYSQDHKRLHFGLGIETRVERIEVHWPGGIIQTIEDIPADQIIKLIEPVAEDLQGRPSYIAGEDQGLMIWKDYYDGPYHMRVSGDGNLFFYDLMMISDLPSESPAQPVNLHSSDLLSQETNVVRLQGAVSGFEDGLDVYFPPAAELMFSFVKNDSSNPRDLRIGVSGAPLVPLGVMGQVADFGAIPSYVEGQSLGLFVGSNRANNESFRLRWVADGDLHYGEVDIKISSPPESVATVSYESGDLLQSDTNSILAAGFVGSSVDGLNIVFSADSLISLVYKQDGLIQPNRIRTATARLSDSVRPAYSLPRTEPFGAPEYNGANQQGLFIWRDEELNQWSVRAIAGGGFRRFRGELVSNQPISGLLATKLEATDGLELIENNRIVFDLQVGGQWEDGFSFDLQAGADLTLIPTAQTFSSYDVLIGSSRWPIANLPVQLGGW